MQRFGRLTGAFLLFAAIVGASASRVELAGDDDDDLADDPASNADQVNEMVVVRNIDANVDSWLFGNRRAGESGRPKLNLLLKTKMDEVSRAAELTLEQQQKLVLAGEGDIRRFVDRVEEIKLRYRTTNFGHGGWNRVFQEIEPLKTVLRNGLFANDSLFAKTLSKTLTPEQADVYERSMSERRLFQHRARIEMTVLRLGTHLGLRDAQRKQLVQLMVEQTEPQPTLEQPDRDQVVGLYLLSRLPDKRLKPIFDAQQWRELQSLFNRVPQVMPALQQEKIRFDRVLRQRIVPAEKGG
jgi:hypothetical protein